MTATTYYKRPSNYEVVFDRVPSYARGFEKLYTDVGDPAYWAKRFVITYAGDSDTATIATPCCAWCSACAG